MLLQNGRYCTDDIFKLTSAYENRGIMIQFSIKITLGIAINNKILSV